MANVNFLSGSKASWDALLTKDAFTFYLVDDNGHKELYLGAELLTSQDELEAALTRLDGAENVTNSIRNIVKGYIEGLDSAADIPIATVSNDVVTIKAGLTEVDGIIANNSGTDIVLAKAAITADSEDISYDNTTSGMTATDVQTALDELAEASAGGVDSKTVYITETPGGSLDPFSRRYGIYQGANGSSASPVAAEKLADLDVPKDMVVEEGAVVDITYDATEGKLYDGAVDVTELIVGSGTPSASDAGKYIRLTIANATSDKLYIAASSLVDVYTGSVGAEATVTIGNDNSISVSINKVSATKSIYREAQEAHGEPGDPDYEPAVAEQSVKAKIDSIDGVIAAMDADLDASGTPAHSGTFVVSGVTQVDGVLTAVDSVEVEAAGAAAAVLGTSPGRSGSGTEQDPYVYDETVRGNRTLIEDLVAGVEESIEDLDVTEFPLAEKNSSTNVVTIHGISEADGKITVGVNSGNDVVLEPIAGSGAAADVSIADAGSYTTETTVEGAIQELYSRLTWGSFPTT